MTRTPDPLIKSQIQSDQNRTLTRKPKHFESRLLFLRQLRVYVSAQVQAQNKHSRTLKTGTALGLQAAFVDINIRKS